LKLEALKHETVHPQTPAQRKTARVARSVEKGLPRDA
jgi:hypothetical protein